MKKEALVIGMVLWAVGFNLVNSMGDEKKIISPTIDKVVATPSAIKDESQVEIKIQAHGADPNDVLGFNIMVDAKSPIAGIAGFTPYTFGNWPENRYYPPMPYMSPPSSLAEGTVWFPLGGWVFDTDGVITLNVESLQPGIYELSAQVFVIGGPEPARYGTYASKSFSITK
jgi:hypothetical protein